MSDEQPDDPQQTWTQPEDSSHVFFKSWALWEKMCFVLAIAIAIVCLGGFLKLQWNARLLRRHELKDEEKAAQARIPERRAKMTKAKSDKNMIPFGIRALESGMEIDGIWVSRQNTPIPENLKEARGEVRTSAGSTDSKGESNKSRTTERSLKLPSPEGQASQPSSRHSQSPVDNILASDERWAPRNTNFSSDFTRPGLLKTYSEFGLTSRHSRNPSRNDPSQYKPRRSSQLRFSSYGETQYHEETLSRLEGKVAIESDLLRGSDTQGSRYSSSDAAVADNERSSGSSTESDGTLSGKSLETERVFKTEAKHTTEDVDIKGKGLASQTRRIPSDSFTPRFLGGKISTPADYPPKEAADPFTTPEMSLEPTNAFPTTSARPSSKDSCHSKETRWPLLSDDTPETPEPSPVRTGQVRANKSVRKVNSGFEVLPAGTFGPPAVYMANESGGIFDGDVSAPSAVKMNGKKLQKNNKNFQRSSLLHWPRGG